MEIVANHHPANAIANTNHERSSIHNVQSPEKARGKLREFTIMAGLCVRT